MTEQTLTKPDTEIEVASAPVDYFGFAETHRFSLPDGIQFFEFVSMNEGKKSAFQKLTQRDVVVERQSGNARMRVNPADERHALITQSLTNWNLYLNGQPLPFDEKGKRMVLELFPPKLIEELEAAIRKANPWLVNEISVEDIDKQIEELQELRDQAVERERGEAASATK